MLPLGGSFASLKSSFGSETVESSNSAGGLTSECTDYLGSIFEPKFECTKVIA